jgi:ribosomal protein S18 acetylase RimI-like enzyme
MKSAVPFSVSADTEREEGTISHFLRAMRDGQELGYVRYEHRRGRLCFITGISVRYEWRGRGIARTLLDELARREYPARRLGANSARENTLEGETLLRSWSGARGIVLVRIDEGLDGV